MITTARWGEGAPLLFVMLNPSTADAINNDATIHRCIRFAELHGFPAIEVVNLFAYRATKPIDLKRMGYERGPDNDSHIAAAAKEAGAVCLAWGVNAKGLSRPDEVLTILRSVGAELQCLRITASGYPQHPLMLPSVCRLMPYSLQTITDAVQGVAA
jgi:hypothetical protein